MRRQKVRSLHPWVARVSLGNGRALRLFLGYYTCVLRGACCFHTLQGWARSKERSRLQVLLCKPWMPC